MRLAKRLQEADRVLYDRREWEQERADLARFRVNTDKYKELKKVYEEVMKETETNAQAKKGLDICNEMLEPFYPMQMMAAPPDFEATGDASPEMSPELVQEIPPWVELASLRMSQQRGVSYTAAQFALARERAMTDLAQLIEDIMTISQEAGETVDETYKRGMGRIKELQQHQDHGWKGHGPEVGERGSALLRQRLGLDPV